MSEEKTNSQIITSQEFGTITKFARERKFIQEKKILYSKDYYELTQNFIKCYQFLDALKQNLEQDYEIISKKLGNLLKDYKELFIKLYDFCDRIENSELLIEKEYYKEEIKKIVKEKMQDMDHLIAYTFPIGKVDSVYDPDSNVGTN